jgi:hypothetical protein
MLPFLKAEGQSTMRLFHLWPAHDVERHNRPADRYFTATIDDVPPFYLAPIAIRATLNAYLGLAIVTVLVDASEDTLRALQLVDRKDQLTMTVASAASSVINR